MKKRIVIPAIIFLLILLIALPTTVVFANKVEEFDVSFVSDNQTVLTCKQKFGEKVKFPTEEPVKPVDDNYTYTFIGWTLSNEDLVVFNNSGIEERIISEYVVDKNLVFYAVFLAEPIPPATFTVTFKDRLTDEKIAEKHVEFGGTVEAPEPNYHLGYDFSGWSKSLKNITSRTTIYAEYAKHSYTLVKNYLGKSKEEAVLFEEQIVSSNPNVTNSLLFDGWFLDADFQNKIDENAVLNAQTFGITKDTQKINIYAKFSINLATLTLNAANNLTYGNTQNPLQIAGEFDDVEYNYTLKENDADLNAILAAGEHEIKVEVFAQYIDYPQLTQQTILSKTITVQKAKLSASLVADSVVYGKSVKYNLSVLGFKYDDQTLLNEISLAYNLDGQPIELGGFSGEMANLQAKGHSLNAHLTLNEDLLKNYTLENDVVSAEFNVNKKLLNITVQIENAQDNKLTYGTMPIAKIEYSGFEYNDNAQTLFEGSEPSVVFSSKLNAGKHSTNLKCKELDNYTVQITQANFEVVKKDLTIEFKPDAQASFVYGQTPNFSQDNLSFTGFAYDDGVESLTANLAFEFYAGEQVYSLEKFVVGNYSVKICHNSYSSNNYNLICNAAHSFAVSAKGLTINVEIENANNLVYGNTPQEKITFDGLVYGDEPSLANVQIKLMQGEQSFAKLNVGQYNVVVEYNSAALCNYDVEVVAPNSVTVKQAELQITVAANKPSITYGETVELNKQFGAFAFAEDEASFKNAKFEYKKGGEVYSLSTKYFDVGEYSIGLTLPTNEIVKNYNVSILNAEISVLPKEFLISQTATINKNRSGNWSYVPTMLESEFVFEGLLKITTHEQTTITANKTSQLPTNMQWETEFKASLGGVDVTKNFNLVYNFNIELTTHNFEYQKIENQQFVYDSQAHSFALGDVSIDDLQENEKITVSYKYKTLPEGVLSEPQNTAPEFVHVGEYQVEYTITDGYDTAVENYTVKITQATNELTNITEVFNATTEEGLPEEEKPEIQTKENAIDVSYTFNGKEHEINLEKLASSFGNVTIELLSSPEKILLTKMAIFAQETDFSNFAFTDAGEYKFKIIINGTADYAKLETILTIIVNKAEYQVTLPQEQEFTFNGENLFKPIDVSVAQNQEYTINYGSGAEPTLQTLTLTDVNSYTIRYKVFGNNNYNDKSGEYTITINKANYVVTTPTQTEFTYTGENLFKSVEVKVAKNQQYSVNYGETAGEISSTTLTLKNAKTYTIHYKVFGNNNYNDANGNYSLTINKANYTGKEFSMPSFAESIILKIDNGNILNNNYANLLAFNSNLTWVENQTLIAGTKNYKAIYNADKNNFNDYQFEISLIVKKQEIKIDSVQPFEADFQQNLTITPTYSFSGEGITLTESETAHLTPLIKATFKIQDADYKTFGGTYLVSCTFALTSDYFNLTGATTINTYAKLKSVEYNGAMYTIEDALNEAQTGKLTLKANTKFMAENALSSLGVQLYNGEAYRTIKTGVTLFLPYDQSKTSVNETITDVTDSNNKLVINNASYRKLELIVADNLTIINNGTIQIGGITSGGGGDKTNAGHTSGDYAQITLGSNVKIESYGNIDCFGFIMEKSDNNDSQLTMHSGELKMPFVVVEHRGGSKLLTLAGGTFAAMFGRINFKSTPFNRFFMQNVVAKLNIEAKAKLLGHANLRTSTPKQDNTTDINLVGNANNCLLQLSESGRIEAKYNIQTKVTNLNIFGDVKINAMELTIKSPITVSISTKNVLFPISWYYNITLNTLEDKSSATVDASQVQGFKLLPGASLVVGENVTLKTKEIAVYQTFEDQACAAIVYETKEPAVLKIDGTLEVQSIGGNIVAGKDGAQLKITKGTSVTSNEVVPNGGDAAYAAKTYQLSLDGVETPQVKTYVAKSSKWAVLE